MFLLNAVQVNSIKNVLYKIVNKMEGMRGRRVGGIFVDLLASAFGKRRHIFCVFGGIFRGFVGDMRDVNALVECVWAGSPWCIYTPHKLESLILAQDERWRQA